MSHNYGTIGRLYLQCEAQEALIIEMRETIARQDRVIAQLEHTVNENSKKFSMPRAVKNFGESNGD